MEKETPLKITIIIKKKKMHGCMEPWEHLDIN